MRQSADWWHPLVEGSRRLAAPVGGMMQSENDGGAG
jgi:hypothetical protein